MPPSFNFCEVYLALRPAGPRLVRAFFSLEPWQRRMAVVCLFLLPAVGLAIRITRVAKLERLMKRWYGERVCQEAPATIVAHGVKLAHVVRGVAHHGLFRAKCLEQSLTLWYLLRRKGVPAEIHFGARRSGDALVAHAWVEYRGTVLDEKDELIPQFARFKKPLVSVQ